MYYWGSILHKSADFYTTYYPFCVKIHNIQLNLICILCLSEPSDDFSCSAVVMSICLRSDEGGRNPNSSAKLQICPFFGDLRRHVGLGINNDWEIETLSRSSTAARPSNEAQDKDRAKSEWWWLEYSTV